MHGNYKLWRRSKRHKADDPDEYEHDCDVGGGGHGGGDGGGHGGGGGGGDSECTCTEEISALSVQIQTLTDRIAALENSVVTEGTNISVSGNQVSVTDSVTLNGSLTAVTVTCTSDARKKTAIRTIDRVEDILPKITPVWYKWQETGNDVAGVIAQNVQEALPGAVREGSDGFLSVDYNQLIALLLADNRRLNSLIEQIQQP